MTAVEEAATPAARTARRRLRLGMRWWLAAAFAGIAALTAVSVATVTSARTDAAFQREAQELVVGNTVAAAEAAGRTQTLRQLRQLIAEQAARRSLALFAFDGEGRLLTSRVSNGVRVDDVPMRTQAIERVLEGFRSIESLDGGTGTVVAIGVRGDLARGLLAYSRQPELRRQIGVVEEQVARAALWATLAGAAVGLVVAALIGRRLRRLADAARAIEQGDFETRIGAGFPDEVGDLASSLDEMRERLSSTFNALASERDRLDRLLERLDQGVIALDRNLRVEFANQAAVQLLGTPYSVGDLLGEPWPGANLVEMVERLFAPDAVVERTTVTPDADRVYLVTGVPAGSRREHAILVVTDLSERERRERAQRDFATNAAHELRTPVAAIVTSIELLQSGAKDDPTARDDFLDHIDREAHRLARLTRALLVLARAQSREETPRLVPVELASLLSAIAAQTRPRPSVELTVECPPGIAVTGDRDLIEQALTTVIENSVKFTEAGAISVSAARGSNGHVHVDVADTGPGISGPDQDRVFDRFYRAARDRDGFGLGLSIARQAVRVLGGELTLRSQPGEGTTVRVTLRAADGELV